MVEEIIIIGGGIIGMSIAVGLATHQIPVVLVDQQPDYRKHNDTFIDNRCSAITAGSAMIFEKIGLWKNMVSMAQPIWQIRVSDQKEHIASQSRFFVHFNPAATGANISRPLQPLGYMLANRDVRRVLFEQLVHHPLIKYYPGVQLTNILYKNPTEIQAILSDGQTISGKLLIAADGRNSKVRNMANISVVRWSYQQHAMIFNIEHQHPHQGIAIEHFTPGGPLAVLPMRTDGHNKSAIVWTETPEKAEYLYQQPHQFLEHILEQYFYPTLGNIQISGDKKIYPLSGLHASRYVGDRIILIGDAAHAIHPIAGQGLNLGIRDCQALIDIIYNIKRLGLDLGTTSMLHDYERRRRPDNLLLIGATDFLDRLFSNHSRLLRSVRHLGMGLVHRIPPLKRVLMKQAMGLLIDAPASPKDASLSRTVKTIDGQETV